MQKIKQFYLDSINQLKITQNLVVCGLMAELAVVLRYVESLDVGPFIRISFYGITKLIFEFLFANLFTTLPCQNSAILERISAGLFKDL